MKIFGLIDLRSLFIFDNYSDNFENSINAAYKMCEDGVSGLAIIGNFKDALKIYNFLKDKVDIPVTIVVKTERQRKVATKYLMSPIFSKKLLSHSVKTVFPDNANFLKKKMGDIEWLKLAMNILSHPSHLVFVQALNCFLNLNRLF